MKTRWLCSLALLLALASCGDDGSPADAGSDANVDGAPDTSVADTSVADAAVDTSVPLTDAPYQGPWSQVVETDGAVVKWVSRVAPERVAIDVVPEAGGDAVSFTGTSTEADLTYNYGEGSPIVDEPDLPGLYYLNEVPTTGLAPATCYRYTITGHEERGGRFCTTHEASDHSTPIVFYALGDSSPGLGMTGPLLTASRPEQAEFVIHTGDIQYYSAIVESWQLWFTVMRPMLEAAPFLPCIGNHEDEREGEFDAYYGRLFAPGSADGDIAYHHFASGGVHFFSLSSEHDHGPGSAQYEWFVDTLDTVEAETDYRFSIVYFHRPIYTVGDANPDLGLRADLEPIITSHRVPLVLAGHMHGYERFGIDDVTYITTAGGGSVIGDLDEGIAAHPEDAARRLAVGAYTHAMVVTITGDTIEGEAVDIEGVVRDSFEITVAP